MTEIVLVVIGAAIVIVLYRQGVSVPGMPAATPAPKAIAPNSPASPSFDVAGSAGNLVQFLLRVRSGDVKLDPHSQVTLQQLQETLAVTLPNSTKGVTP
jgi:hypothetical protein